MKLSRFLLAAIALIAFNTTQAQTKTTTTTTTTKVSLPDWGVAGYDDARYYYIPDIETYYDVTGRQFVYMKDGQWVKSSELPAEYRDFDLYDNYKVVLTDANDPYTDFDHLRTKYAKGYKGDSQKTIKIKQKKDGTIKIKEKNK